MNTRRYSATLLLLPTLLLGACGQAKAPTTSAVTPEPTTVIAEASPTAQPVAIEMEQADDEQQEAETPTPATVLRLPATVDLPRTVTYSNLEWTITEAWIDNVKLSLFGDSDETTDKYRVAHVTLKLKNPLSRYTDVETSALRFQLGDSEPVETDEAHMLNLPEGDTTTTSNLAFMIPKDADWTGAKLVLSERNREPAELPLDGPMETPHFPAEVGVSGEAHDETSTYTLLGGSLNLDYRGHRTKIGERFLKLQMRVKYDGTGRLAVTGDNFRLLVEGQPIAPEDSIQEVVQPNSVEEGEVVFIVPADISDVELKLGEEGELSIPLHIDEA